MRSCRLCRSDASGFPRPPCRLPLPGPPPPLTPHLRYPMVVWEGGAQKGGHGGGTLAPAAPSMAPPPLATASPPLRWGVELRAGARTDGAVGSRGVRHPSRKGSYSTASLSSRPIRNGNRCMATAPKDCDGLRSTAHHKQKSRGSLEVRSSEMNPGSFPCTDRGVAVASCGGAYREGTHP
jgi:hypothetical protein